jgi:hypothetical protein
MSVNIFSGYRLVILITFFLFLVGIFTLSLSERSNIASVSTISLDEMLTTEKNPPAGKMETVDQSGHNNPEKDSGDDLLQSMERSIEEIDILLSQPIPELPGEPRDIQTELEKEKPEIDALVAKIKEEMGEEAAEAEIPDFPEGNIAITKKDHPEQYKRQQEFLELEQEMNEIVRNIQ